MAIVESEAVLIHGWSDYIVITAGRLICCRIHAEANGRVCLPAMQAWVVSREGAEWTRRLFWRTQSSAFEFSLLLFNA